jgi:hypothetical protein
MKIKIVPFGIVWLCILLACAGQGRSSYKPTATSTNTQPTYTSYPTKRPTPNMTSIWLTVEAQRLPEEVQQRAFDTIKTNNNCRLPCFWGITPGKTSWAEAEEFLGTFNHIYKSEERFRDGPYDQFSTPLDLSDAESRSSLQVSIKVSVGDGIAQRIHVLTAIPGDYSKQDGLIYRKYWFRYSLDQIFKQLGKPDDVYINYYDGYIDKGYRILILYNVDKLAFEYGFLPNSPKALCPNFLYGDMINMFNFSLSHSNSAVDIYPSVWLSPEESEDWRKIDHVFGIDKNKFYGQVLANPSACFMLK